jgi:GAF domain-containing protein
VRHERELDALRAIGRLLAERAGQRELLAETLAFLETKLDMRRATVMLLSPDGQELVVEASRSLHSDRAQHLRYKFGEGITGSVVRTRQPAIVPCVGREPSFRNRFVATSCPSLETATLHTQFVWPRRTSCRLVAIVLRLGLKVRCERIRVKPWEGAFT